MLLVEHDSTRENDRSEVLSLLGHSCLHQWNPERSTSTDHVLGSLHRLASLARGTKTFEWSAVRSLFVTLSLSLVYESQERRSVRSIHTRGMEHVRR